MKIFTLKINLFKKKQETVIDYKEMQKFYIMLSKMKKKRTHLNIDWVMESVYKNNYNNNKEKLKKEYQNIIQNE